MENVSVNNSVMNSVSRLYAEFLAVVLHGDGELLLRDLSIGVSEKITLKIGMQVHLVRLIGQDGIQAITPVPYGTERWLRPHLRAGPYD
jgi:hypothetical protein